MSSQAESVNASAILTSKGGPPWPTTEAPLSPEEEDAIVTLVVVVIGIIVAIAVLFCMGIFIDCKHQKQGPFKKKRQRLKMPTIVRSRKIEKDDVKSLASDMCPTGAIESSVNTRDALV